MTFRGPGGEPITLILMSCGRGRSTGRAVLAPGQSRRRSYGREFMSSPVPQGTPVRVEITAFVGWDRVTTVSPEFPWPYPSESDGRLMIDELRQREMTGVQVAEKLEARGLSAQVAMKAVVGSGAVKPEEVLDFIRQYHAHRK